METEPNEKLKKYVKRYWWVIALLFVLWIVGVNQPPEKRNYILEANNMQEKIESCNDLKRLSENLDSASRLLEVMNGINDNDSNFVLAKNNLDTLVKNRNAIYENMSRKIKLDNLFGVNGKCFPVSRIIKKGMNNPDSYEFVSSEFKVIDNNTFLVTERCRGTNAYGGIITVEYEAVVTIDGDVLSLKQL